MNGRHQQGLSSLIFVDLRSNSMLPDDRPIGTVSYNDGCGLSTRHPRTSALKYEVIAIQETRLRNMTTTDRLALELQHVRP